jgi:sugar phosphate isomerase/epimerase
MIHSGLVSVTFRKLTPAEIVAAVKQAGLRGIEWGGDVHVPHGDLGTARHVRELTEQAGLEVAAYGSYYRVGQSESDGLPFERVLETALELGAPTIRVWPGTAASDATDDETRWKIVHELRRIADLAARAGLTVALEYHAGTLTDTDDSASQLLVEVDHGNLYTLWQPHNGIDPAINLAGLEQVKTRVSNLHVFHWGATNRDRRPLAEGEAVWTKYLAAITAQAGERYALLEFVAGDSLEAFQSDAAVLRRWLAA